MPDPKAMSAEQLVVAMFTRNARGFIKQQSTLASIVSTRDATLLAPYEAFVRAVKGCGSGAWNDPKFVTAVLALDNAVLALKEARKESADA